MIRVWTVDTDSWYGAAHVSDDLKAHLGQVWLKEHRALQVHPASPGSLSCMEQTTRCTQSSVRLL